MTYAGAVEMITTDPCSLEQYTRVRAEVAYARLPLETVLERLGIAAASWHVSERYWMPRVSSSADPEFDIVASLRFLQLMKLEAARLSGLR